MSDMYKKIKRQNGETFARELRNFHNGLLEIPDLDKIVRHAGSKAEPLLPYLMSLMASNDDVPVPSTQDPFLLLDRAGYKAFYADTLDAQNSIQKYFAPGELLCTFNDSARYKDYHIIHAVKKDVDGIKRADFMGQEQREDAYGTSVISIQMLKSGGFISIKNRYNHAVAGCDNTFNSNPDNIIGGLSGALKERFGIEFSASQTALPEGFVEIAGQILKYHTEQNNIYYGDQTWMKDGVIHAVDKSAGDALFDRFLFDHKSKTLTKIDPNLNDSFADDFNRCYGGSRGLAVQNGNLVLDGELLIGAEKSRITTLCLPALTSMGNNCLREASALTQFEAPALTTMGSYCLHHARALTQLEAPALTTMNSYCLHDAYALTQFEAPALMAMGEACLRYARVLTQFEAPALTTMSSYCLRDADALTQFEAPALTTMGVCCLNNVRALTQFEAPALTTMGDDCLGDADALTQFEAPALTTMGSCCLNNASALTQFEAPALTTMGDGCLGHADALTQFKAPALTTMGDDCLGHADALTQFEAQALTTMGACCLSDVHALTQFEAPALKTMGNACISVAYALTQFEAPALKTMGHYCLGEAHALTQFEAPALRTMGDRCLNNARALTQLEAPALRTMGLDCLSNASALTQFEAPALTTMGDGCFSNASMLTRFETALASLPDNLQRFAKRQSIPVQAFPSRTSPRPPTI